MQGLGIKGLRDQKTVSPEPQALDPGQKQERGGDESPRLSLIESLWEQYAPGGGNYMQNGGGKSWGNVLGVVSTAAISMRTGRSISQTPSMSPLPTCSALVYYT